MSSLLLTSRSGPFFPCTTNWTRSFLGSSAIPTINATHKATSDKNITAHKSFVQYQRCLSPIPCADSQTIARPRTPFPKSLLCDIASTSVQEQSTKGIPIMSGSPVWFITAASSGFGKFIALEALSRGHRVIATARNAAKIADLKEKGAETMSLDVTWELSKIEKVAEAANAKYGQINHLVNAAGYILVGAVEETSPAEDLAVFNTNVFGLLNVSKAFLPYLRATSGHRTITNFGSIGSWRGGPGYALYAGTKWACSGISESMTAELAPLGIAVTIVEPGYFRTGFLNAGAQISSEKRMKEYDESAVGHVRAMLDKTNNNQPGDVEKGAKVIVDVMTKEGGREIPMRLPLGTDCEAGIRAKCNDTISLLDSWKGVITSTDHA